MTTPTPLPSPPDGPGPAAPLDALVVGAGAAGRAAALVLGRARRSVLLVDAGRPSNLPATAVGGLLGHDGRPPAELYALSDGELERYPSVGRRTDEVVALDPAPERDEDDREADDREDAAREADREPPGQAGTATDAAAATTPPWRARLADGTELLARHVVLAMGMTYDYPPLPGIEPLWGASVFHCPFCHGWEHRDRPLAVLGGGPATVDRTLLLAGWTEDLRLVAPPGSLEPAERAVLARASVEVVEGRAARLHGSGRQLEAVELEGGRLVVPVEGLLVTAGHRQRSRLVADAGVALDDTGHVVVDGVGRTSQPGIWAVGDLTSPVSLVARAAATGAEAGVWLVHALTAAGHGRAFPPPGAPGGGPYAPRPHRH